MICLYKIKLFSQIDVVWKLHKATYENIFLQKKKKSFTFFKIFIFLFLFLSFPC